VGSPGAPEEAHLRVLWLIDSLTVGGAEALVVEFASTRQPGDAEFHVCCLSSIAGNAREADVRAAGVPFTNLGARSLRDLRAFRRLLALLRAERPQLVHAHLRYASIWGAVAARLAGIPLVATLHMVPDGAPWWSADGARERLTCLLLDRWSAGVIAVSAAVSAAYARSGRIRAGKLWVVHNGVDCNRIAAASSSGPEVRREIGVGATARVVATASVLRPGKGVEVLLAAAPRVRVAAPDAVFLIAGDGPERRALEDRAAALGASGMVRFLGQRRDVPRILAASDLFVLASHFDAFPTVLLEAMAAGLPVVATDVGGIPEIVEVPSTGCLVPPADPGALAASITALLQAPERRREMGARARARGREHFSTEAWCRRLARVYAEAVGKRGGTALEGRRRDACRSG
jgi:glycosyltransferase involved in cell wall biosynthesis